MNQQQKSVDVEAEITSLKKTVKFLQTENTRLTKENNEFKRLINDHASKINKLSTGQIALERNMRNEMNRIAAGFKKVQAILNRNHG